MKFGIRYMGYGIWKYALYLIPLYLIPETSSAQQSVSDSLEFIFNSTQSDSSKINSATSWVRALKNDEQYNKAIQVGEKALPYVHHLKDPQRESVLITIIAIANYYKGNFAKALEYYFMCLKIREEINDTLGLGSLLNNIGMAYEDMENFDMAKDYLLRGLELRQKAGDSAAVAKSLNNIGYLLYSIGTKMEPVAKEKLFDSAMYYFNRSIIIARVLNKKFDISNAIGNIGNVFKDRGQTKEALEHYQQCLKIGEELDDKVSIVVSNIQLGDLYSENNNFEKALMHYNEALRISNEIENLDNEKSCYQSMSGAYEKSGDYKHALEMYKNFSLLKDTLVNSEGNKQIAEMQTIYDTEKKDAEINLLNKDKEIQAGDLKKQRIFIYSAIAVIALVLTLVFFVYRSNKQKHFANVQLEKKNHEIEEQKNEILSSIRYAKRIQQAMLKEEEKVSSHLPDHFVLFKPKDIVSGDFYWATEKRAPLNPPEGGTANTQWVFERDSVQHAQAGSNAQGKLPPLGGGGAWWYVAAADCTGHGVPGAFLTMLGMSFLNEITITSAQLHPAEILDELRNRVIKELSQTGKEGESKDGMDISLMTLNLDTLEMEWAGANNALYIIPSAKADSAQSAVSRTLREIKADKQPIGYFPEQHPFTNHKFQLQRGDTVYIFTDGYADQFGGPKGKKFKYSQFEKLLVSIRDKSMSEQKKILANTIEEWKGSLEQVDDICIIGVKI